ncbi:MAG: hypothetical protein AVDCRST_MAG93-5666 [uncultured Chloroflexia bacterium]|uniref:Uncharacterized protein n=1 Tax=uncultured Chloroflexia bacterium TaxID=1672391 RepID=A0A6J4L4L0_9CHLR|nr:MAG: hypothetical protein AVDCRST_MAG93-5666 [uncultured Chloroflexia bacterium]
MEDDGLAEREEVYARIEVAEAALMRLGELEVGGYVKTPPSGFAGSTATAAAVSWSGRKDPMEPVRMGAEGRWRSVPRF